MGHEPLEESEGHGEEEGPGADLRLRHQVCRGVELPGEDFWMKMTIIIMMMMMINDGNTANNDDDDDDDAR